MKITKVNAIYTGGNIWMFCGSLEDGNFFLTDDDGYTLILNADPNADLEEASFPEWQDAHLVRELEGDERIQFCDEMLTKLSSYEYGSEENGGITEDEIDGYFQHMKEDF